MRRHIFGKPMIYKIYPPRTLFTAFWADAPGASRQIMILIIAMPKVVAPAITFYVHACAWGIWAGPAGFA